MYFKETTDLFVSEGHSKHPFLMREPICHQWLLDHKSEKPFSQRKQDRVYDLVEVRMTI